MFCENVVLNDTGWLFGEKTVWTGEEQLVSNIIQWIVVRCGTLLHDFVNGLVNTLLNDKEVLKYIMGEVMICRGGGCRRSGGSSGKNYGEGGGTLTTLVFANNEKWKVPEGIIDNWVSIRMFGGGGGLALNSYGGGGSGWMANDILKLSPGEEINITIGRGGERGYAGGITSFGGYFSANGGQAGFSNNGGSGGAGGGGGFKSITYRGGDGYQFGGGGGCGRGGVWGGGGGGAGSIKKNGNTDEFYCFGGDGGTYGGGGGSRVDRSLYNTTYLDNCASMGGTYGGGGGVFLHTSSYREITNTASILKECNIGSGGEFGGNGGTMSLYNTYYYNYTLPEDGINTIGMENIYNDGNCRFDGSGLKGIGGSTYLNGETVYMSGGGGGYGGNGGNGIAGGGGGYGSNGGSTNLTYITNSFSIGAGGGGYGGDGGNLYMVNTWAYGDTIGAGGGGYGKVSIGGSAKVYWTSDSLLSVSGGGGGYYCPGRGWKEGPVDKGGGGGGGFIFNSVEYASGGDLGRNISGVIGSGLNGVCIVQFYRDL